MARTVRDAALLLQAMAGSDPRDPLSLAAAPGDYVAACDGDLKGLRVLWSADLGYAPVDPEVRSLAEGAARRFADFGCVLESRDPGWPDPGAFHKIIYEVSVASRRAISARRRGGRRARRSRFVARHTRPPIGEILLGKQAGCRPDFHLRPVAGDLERQRAARPRTHRPICLPDRCPEQRTIPSRYVPARPAS